MTNGKAKEITEPAPHDKDGSNEVRSIAEWVTLIVSVAVLAGMFATVTYLHLTGNGDPITIRTEAQLNQIRVSEEAFYVPISVFNDGATAAGNVQIEAVLRTGDERETSEFSIITLAANDTETGIVAFSLDPREGEFIVRVASYLE